MPAGKVLKFERPRRFNPESSDRPLGTPPSPPTPPHPRPPLEEGQSGEKEEFPPYEESSAPYDYPEDPSVEPETEPPSYRQRPRSRPRSRVIDVGPSEYRGMSSEERREMMDLAKMEAETRLMESISGRRRKHYDDDDDGAPRRRGFGGIKMQVENFSQTMKEINEVYGTLASFNAPSPLQSFMNSPLGGSIGSAIGQVVPGFFDMYKTKTMAELNMSLQEKANQRFMEMNEKQWKSYAELMDARRQQMEREAAFYPQSQLPRPPPLPEIPQPNSLSPPPQGLVPMPNTPQTQMLQQQAQEMAARQSAEFTRRAQEVQNTQKQVWTQGTPPPQYQQYQGQTQSPPQAYGSVTPEQLARVGQGFSNPMMQGLGQGQRVQYAPPQPPSSQAQQPLQSPAPAPPRQAGGVDPQVVSLLSTMNRTIEEIAQSNQRLAQRIASLENGGPEDEQGHQNATEPVETSEGDEREDEAPPEG